jgi:glycerol-3-phosphate dehydrogenase (NAD(P)+)
VVARSPLLVAGAGSWGTALAILVARNGHPALLWGRDSGGLAALARDRTNARYLPGMPFPGHLTIIADFADGLRQAGSLIVAVPCHGLRQVLALVRQAGGTGIGVALACKGIEIETGLLPHQIVEAELGPQHPTAVISGPTFAGEVAAGLPTAVVVASASADFAADLIARLHGGTFRAYRGDDVLGVEVGGAVKNVLAIAAGVSDGLGFGANSRAALITRGLAEVMRLGAVMGARRDTFMGLAGLGDLVLTCTQDQSRNRRLGVARAPRAGVEAAIAAIGQAVEGVRTAQAVAGLARKYGVEMPIAMQVARLLRGECTPREAVQSLLAREPRAE